MSKVPKQFRGGWKSGPKPPGRPVRFKIENVHHVLSRHGLNPTEEILKLIPLLDFKDQVQAWFWLLAYTQPKPKPIEEKTIDAVNELVEKLDEVSTTDLVNLVKSEGQDDTKG